MARLSGRSGGLRADDDGSPSSLPKPGLCGRATGVRGGVAAVRPGGALERERPLCRGERQGPGGGSQKIRLHENYITSRPRVKPAGAAQVRGRRPFGARVAARLRCRPSSWPDEAAPPRVSLAPACALRQLVSSRGRARRPGAGQRRSAGRAGDGRPWVARTVAERRPFRLRRAAAVRSRRSRGLRWIRVRARRFRSPARLQHSRAR